MGLNSWSGFKGELGRLASSPLGYIGESLGKGMDESPDEARTRLLSNEFRQVGPQLGNIADQRGQLAGQWMRGIGPQAGESSFRGDQQQLINQLQSQFAGNGPGQEIARRQAMMQAGAQNQALAGALAGSRSGQGGSNFLAAANQMGNVGGAAANAATMGGLQAQMNAGNLLGSTLQGARGQDLQRAQFNVGAQFQNRDQAMQLLQQQLAARQAEEQARTSRFGTIGGQASQNLPNQTSQGLGFLQGLLEMGMKGK